MINGRWGKPNEVLLDLVVEEGGKVRGVANPGRQNAPIRRGHFDATSGAVNLEGEAVRPDGTTVPFRIEGRLDDRTLRLAYQFGEMEGTIDVVRVEEYRPRPLSLWERLKPRVEEVKRRINARSRPTGEENARKLRGRNEPLESITFRDAVAADIPRWPAARHDVERDLQHHPRTDDRDAHLAMEPGLRQENRRDFVLVLEDRSGRLIGFTWGKPNEGEFEGQLSKIYLRWEYHGLGLGRRMMAETARRFLERGIHSFILFAELSNPTLGFYDRMGGERLLDDRGQFGGAYGWRDVRTLIR
jgi:ribosomal protein S18 acetylase RimI-like enzyme